MKAGRDEAAAVSSGWTASVRWALASLSLTMLLSSLGTSIANVALPTLAQVFHASFQFILSIMPATLGISGYIAPIVVITVGYALFQTANNTAVMTGIRADQRGVMSGMLNLSRNLGLITGASAMGAVFALASRTIDITTARPEAVASGMRITFAVAATLIVFALAIAVAGRALAARRRTRVALRHPVP